MIDETIDQITSTSDVYYSFSTNIEKITGSDVTDNLHNHLNEDTMILPIDKYMKTN